MQCTMTETFLPPTLQGQRLPVHSTNVKSSEPRGGRPPLHRLTEQRPCGCLCLHRVSRAATMPLRNQRLLGGQILPSELVRDSASSRTAACPSAGTWKEGIAPRACGRKQKWHRRECPRGSPCHRSPVEAQPPAAQGACALAPRLRPRSNSTSRRNSMNRQSWVLHLQGTGLPRLATSVE